MLRIIPTPNDKEILHSFLPPNNDIPNKITVHGLWLEYWEDPIVNFKFFLFQNTIHIPKTDFFEGYSEEEISDFIRSTEIKWTDLLEWVDKEVKMEVLEILPINSPEITKIWKYDYKLEFQDTADNKIYQTKALTVRLQDSKIIRSLPYRWESHIRYYSQDVKDKLYWFTLCHLKFQIALN